MSYCVWPGSCVHACENRGAGRSALQAGWLERGVLQVQNLSLQIKACAEPCISEGLCLLGHANRRGMLWP
eukprot:scaffold14531_cov21-Tisochrysis_lutea.AAC.3